MLPAAPGYEMHRVLNGVPVHTEVKHVIGVHSDRGLICVETGRQRSKIPHPGEDPQRDNHDKKAIVDKALDKRGLTAFDARQAAERYQAVSKTVGVSLELLTADERTRYTELAVFPEDVDIPLVTVRRLWDATGGLDDIDTETLCAQLANLSLLLRFDLGTRTIRLHDVMRTYLAHELSVRLPELHARLLDAHRPASPVSPSRSKEDNVGDWANLLHDEPYLWDHLAFHCSRSGAAQNWWRRSRICATWRPKPGCEKAMLPKAICWRQKVVHPTMLLSVCYGALFLGQVTCSTVVASSMTVPVRFI